MSSPSSDQKKFLPPSRRRPVSEAERGLAEIREILRGVCHDRGWERRLAIHEVFRFWDELVGGQIAALARPGVLRGDVLWVDVVDAAWMQQLHLLKVDLLERINQRLAEGWTGEGKAPELKDLRLRLAAEGTFPPPAPPRRGAASPPEVSGRSRAWFEDLLAALDDESLKDRFRVIWLAATRNGPPTP